jgi:pimeloyl-ACP methyl ester carboxylesterase
MSSHSQPERFSLPCEDGVIAGWRWKNKTKPPLLFSHATGFCASAYKKMLQSLAEDFDVFAVDMRGHGRTTLPAEASKLRSWGIYAKDLNTFLDRQARGGWTLAGHSMGAVTASMAALGRGDVSALRLIEPVALPPLYSIAAKTPFWGPFVRSTRLVRGTARRRSEWPDRETAAASYRRKALFRGWAEGALEDYLEDGLEGAGPGVRLSCDPRWEAATFAAQANAFWPAVRNAPAAVSVLAANHPSTTTRSGARRRFRHYGAALAEIGGVTHLAPMEKPGIVASFIAGGEIAS